MTDHVLDEAQGVPLGRLVEQTDWDASPLGHPDSWPEGLRTLFATCLECRFAFCMWWGPELGFLYNDAYAPMLGAKHPALGRVGAEVWIEIWDVVGPMLHGVMRSGEATHSDDLLLVMRRHGYVEEAYFTFSYSPIRDASGTIVGIFTPVVETTARVVGERRLRTLRDLAARCLDAASAEEACRLATAVLAENPHDVPFALLYRIGGDGDQASLAGSAGVEAVHAMAPRTIALDDPRAAWTLTRSHQSRIVEDLGQRFVDIPTGAWPDPPARALILPIGLHGNGGPAAILIVGINPRRELDEEHRGFHTLLGGQIATVLARVFAYEEERRRAEKLAEIDRAKTAFFSNISHEFRTPLTLILGPLEEALSRATPEDHALLEVAHRNGLRLLRLVNALLDFSRVEAGRAQAGYEPQDLAALTADLAGNFRAACERAGVALDVDCPPMARPVFVDRDMWEMIVLNLVSNAFKFTFRGRITVGLRDAGDAAELTVRDTGIGIAEAELPRLFERFHRVEDARGRTMEGSGIGLALVQELVKLHGGTIGVESAPGRGSALTVRVPFGTAHLPADRIGAARPASSAGTAQAFAAEALRWLPGAEPRGADSMDAPPRPRILLADDNADMRDYVRRLLGAQYDVEAVSDGQAALEAAARDPPDLVLTDVMMPRLDGIGLLRALRDGPPTRDLPIILLSARAGEEARIEGLDAGADDYLAKPFAARELLARVRANLDLARARREASATSTVWRDRYEAAARASGDLLFDWNAETGELLFGSELERVTGYTHAELAGGIRAWLAIVHPEDRTRVNRELVRLRTTNGSGHASYRVIRKDGRVVELEARGHFVRDPSNGGRRMVGFARDVTDRNRAEMHQAMLIDELNHRVKNTLAAVQSIAHQTLRGSGSLGDVGERFTGRLMSLSQTHSLLTDSRWRGADLRGLVLAELSPYRGDEAAPRVTLRGEAVHLGPKTALALGMALHELAINAAKHGALSCQSGSVVVSWQTAKGEDGVPRLLLSWTEMDGPPVTPPARRGFGSRLLERGLAMELNGGARLHFDPAGLRCEIEFPMRGEEVSP
ncbi:MAG: ATP-binding protein [Acetobacteraceae bacterium]